ncbi:unnamed protein product [Staurois parvus]|uniref:Secreted protein n=1 Tax=Staurois parvus TaxID=386267 RepID=A0ABN9HC91_9NEOB|nr:unnamed protein product [Staurois parvus]
MRMAAYLAVALVVLSVIVEAERSTNREAQRPAPAEPIRRRGTVNQRGRKKTIWSYNPGHRSLAFLVAGEVEVVSPPPVDSVTGVEYRCLGCCGERALVGGKSTSSPRPSNRVGRIVLRPDGLAVIGTEPNSVNDRCLGCCEDNGVTTSGTTTTTTTTATTTKARRVMKIPITGRQRAWQARRGAPYENPNWRFESSSSSEEISMVRRPPPRSRFQPIRSRGCDHHGCRSPLGSVVDDSSSSEED